jgi:hypothetical protein
MLGAGSNGTLEGMRVNVDESRKDGASVQSAGRAEIFRRLGDASDAAFRTANQGQAAYKAAGFVDEIGQPDGLVWGGIHLKAFS